MSRMRRNIFSALFFLALFALPGGYVECDRGHRPEGFDFYFDYWEPPYAVYYEPVWFW